MAPIKRKLDASNDGAQPMKRPKPKPSSTTKSAILKNDEPSFPRGGASILTPFEHKQIQIQAKQDVLFEQSTGTKAARNEFEHEENDEDLPEQRLMPVTKSKRKFKTKEKKRGKDSVADEPAVRIEGLSYKVSQNV